MRGPRARRLLFLCNALDDPMRLERRITTDSPAASRKVFMMLDALRAPGTFGHAISLGRGRRDGSPAWYPATLRRGRRFVTLYLPFTHRRFLSELLSFVAPVAPLWRLRRSARRTTLLFYNRERAWLLALVVGRLLGYRTALDLEDGEVGIGRRARGVRQFLFDRLCTGGTMLACSQLLAWTKLRPAICYYGVVDAPDVPRDWHAPTVHVLLGGTLTAETGTGLLADAVALLREAAPPWAGALELHVTGKGEGRDRLDALAADAAAPRIVVHGRTTDAEYRAIGDAMHAGLNLRLHAGNLADTTFPSKVTEMAGAGLLVLGTDVSDVRAVLGDGAVYVERDDPALLIERLEWIVTQRADAAAAAARGLARVRALCAPGPAGTRLRAHLFDAA